MKYTLNFRGKGNITVSYTTMKAVEKPDTKSPLVSIVMPTYNAAEYLPDTLAGLTKQTFTDFEIIFVDDGSEDETVSILQDFAAQDCRAMVLEQAHQFAGAARNLGMQHARGKYLLFLDGDDFFLPQMLEKSVEKAEQTEADICVFRANRINHVTGEVSEMPWMMKTDKCPEEETFSIQTNAKHIYEFTSPAPWNKLYRSAFVKKYGLTFQETMRSNDVAFVLTSLALADKITIINEALLMYRFNNPNSLQGANDQKPDCFYEAMKELKNRLVKYGVYEQAKPAFLNYVVEVSFYNLMTLKNAFSYEKTFALIRDDIFENFGIKDLPDDYFYAYSRTADRRNDILSLSMYDFFKKWAKRGNRVPEDMYGRTAAAVTEKGGTIEPNPRPKISVIMPCLNSMEYMDECLSSVLAQTLKDIEIICVDAGSTDGTVEYIQEKAAQDARISLVHSEKKSYGYQVNLGMDHARGEFMAIVESDDYILPEMYEKLYALAWRYSVEVVKSDFSRFYGDREHRTFTPAPVLRDKKKYNQVTNVQSDSDIWGAYVLITPAIYSLDFLRKSQIRLHESPGASYQDNGFWFQVLMHAERMWFYPESLYMLRRDNPNSSVKSKGKVYAMCAEYDFIRGLIGDDPEMVQRFAPQAAKRRFYNYEFTLDRIADECKLDFLIRFAQDFRKIRDAGELHGNLFSDTEWEQLTDIMDDPARYYLAKYYHAKFAPIHRLLPLQGKKKIPPKKAPPRVPQLAAPRKGLRQKVQGLLRCIDENGYLYTLKRIIEHMGIDMGTPDFKRKHG